MSVTGYDVATPIDLDFGDYILDLTSDTEGVNIDKSSADIKISPISGKVAIPAFQLTIKVTAKSDPSIFDTKVIDINSASANSKDEYQVSMILGEPVKPLITEGEERQIQKVGTAEVVQDTPIVLGDPDAVINTLSMTQKVRNLLTSIVDL